ncbi:hypothetical protein REPUB_Repub17cG0045800 [Reevesia pubescens]
MEFPFPNSWNASSRPRYEQSLRGIPVVQVNPKAKPPQPQALKPKVVSIPVHFVGSEQRGRSDSATKIQKVFRGFLVRKNMETIKAIREEVNAIERSVSKTETVDLIRNNSKERLKVNEMLMSLLLKLDSVRGVDSGVRDCRKSVIRKAIALQELVDAIVSGDQFGDSNKAEPVDQDQSQGIITDSADNCNQTLESQNHDDMTNQYRAEFVPNFSESEVIPQNQGIVDESNNKQVVANQEQEQGQDEDSIETSRSESQTDSSANPNPENLVEEEEVATYCQPNDEIEKEGSNINSRSKEDWGENKKSKEELLERIMEDNEKMMGLMEVLYERNEMQTRLLSTLSHRVEQLEKAFLCDKLRKKKRRSASAAASVDSDVKKCGKRL